jgi:predicted N-acetyltransferase YhbS
VTEIRAFAPADLSGVLALCTAEGWTSLPADPARALRILTAPGVTTVVAVDGDAVIGFAELFSDGELQAYLATLAVDRTRRGEGLGRSLVTEGLKQAGGERIDTLSEDDATGFYRKLPHFEKPGLRLYPFHRSSGA